MKKQNMIGIFALLSIFAMVAATITYNADYDGTIGGTIDSKMLSFAEGDQVGTFGTSEEGFEITSVDIAEGATLKCDIVTVTNVMSSSVNVVITVSGADASIVTITSGDESFSLANGASKDIEITIDPSGYKSSASYEFTLNFAVALA